MSATEEKEKRTQTENISARHQATASAPSRYLHESLAEVPTLLITANIFPSIPPTTDPYALQTQRIATRLFMVLFFLAFVILLVYSSINTTDQIITITKPDLVQYDQLYSLSPATLSCPCSQISVPYKTFMQIDYALHPICRSDFVTDTWIDRITSVSGQVGRGDFRAMGLFLFQALRSLCQLSEDTITDSLNQFQSQSYITTTLTARETLHTQANALIDQFVSTTTTKFTSFLRMIMDTSQVNGLASSLFTGYGFSLYPDSEYIVSYPTQYDGNCICVHTMECTSQLFLRDNSDVSLFWPVPGLYRGCFIIQALRNSHLGCFFDQTCLNEIDDHVQSQLSLDLAPLDASLLVHFTPNTTMDLVIDALMVDQWNRSEIFTHYYNACAPAQCTYTVVRRDSLIGIVTTMIGLIGGLVTILKLAVPQTVGVVRWTIRARAAPITDDPSLNLGQLRRQRLSLLIQMVTDYLRGLNLFPSEVLPSDPYDEETGRISTRIFIIIILVTFICLLVYTSAVIITNIVTVPHPTVEQFNELSLEHGKTLSCPCSAISTKYDVFIDVSYSLHQVCKSDFVTEQWRRYIGDSNEWLPWFDFRLMGGFSFQALQSLCELAEDTVISHAEQFLSNYHISTSAMPKQLFDSQMNATIQQFISSMVNTFTWSLELIRSTTQYNTLLSALLTNFILYKLPDYSQTLSAPRVYGGCNCAYERSCATQLFTYHDGPQPSVWYVPGFYMGCFVLEGLTQSRLECLYNQTCLQQLDLNLGVGIPLNATALNSSIISRFAPDATVGSILDALMVDEWQWSVQHQDYFSACRPLQCTYTVTERRSIILIVTTLIGLFGGLVTSFKLILPRVTSLIRWRLKQRPNDVPDQAIEQRLRRLVRGITQYVITLNLFPSYPPTNDRHAVRAQYLSTKVFIFTLILTSTVLFIYTVAAPSIQILTHSTSDYSQYKTLFAQYWSTLRCPCAQIATTYETIVDVSYSIHPVCSSMFVTDEWIRYIGSSQAILVPSDFRLTATFQFQALQYLCELVVDFIDDQVQQFRSKAYISTELTSEEVLVPQMNTTIQQFISLTENGFKLPLRSMRDVTQANAIISALQQNFQISFSNPGSVSSGPVFYGNSCLCSARVDCVMQSPMYSETGAVDWLVPEFYCGCSTLESLRQSRFDCFFDQTCLDELNPYLMSTSSMDLVALDSSALHHFFPNSPIGEIIDKLMVDEWKWTINHEKYYNSCQPVECSYEIVQKSSPTVIVTTLLGLIGGLVTALKLVVPRTVKVALILWQHQRRDSKRSRINPAVPRTTVENIDV